MEERKATATNTPLANNVAAATANNAATPTQQTRAKPQLAWQPHFEGKPYLQCLQTIENSFPPLKSFLRNIGDVHDHDREIVDEYYQTHYKRGPGRCYCLLFGDSGVSLVEENGFKSPDSLRFYLERNPATESRQEKKQRRLFILEDMDPDYVDALGHHLGVDPLTFSEQTNTWNFTDSISIPYRGLPSMAQPQQAFTLRYYEIRTLFDPKEVDSVSLQMTFAINKRRYERWKDVDVPSAGKPDRRHAFVRRCASFWTSQDPTEETDFASGWDAVIMVDPAFVQPSTMPSDYTVAPQPPKSSTDPRSNSSGTMPQVNTNQTWPINRNRGSVTNNGTTRTTGIHQEGFKSVPESSKSKKEKAEAFVNDGLKTCYILKNPTTFPNRAELWKKQDIGDHQDLQKAEHKSWPYHHGGPTLAPLVFSQIGVGAKESESRKFIEKRDLASPLDEMVYYWTKVANPKLIKNSNACPSNASYYLLKHIAQHWTNTLELITTTIAKAEWFADDYQASIDDALSLQRWKSDLSQINKIAQDINYMRRHLNYFGGAIVLNLERLGVQLGAEAIDDKLSIALQDAQKDFLTIYTRMGPLRDRAEALNSVSNDLSNLRAAYRGVHDSEFSLRLSIFASIVFPLTLVAGIFSMGGDYQPGQKSFWKFWAIGASFCAAIALGLVYGRRPWQIFPDFKEFCKYCWKQWNAALEKMKQSNNEKEKKKKEEDAAVRKRNAGRKRHEESRA